MKLAQTLLLFLAVVGMSSCGDPSPETLRRRGDRVLEALVEELECISSKETLVASQPQLKEYFLNLSKILLELEARDELQEVPENPLGKRLKAEMARVYQIDGARELVEAAQEPARLALELDRRR